MSVPDQDLKDKERKNQKSGENVRERSVFKFNNEIKYQSSSVSDFVELALQHSRFNKTIDNRKQRGEQNCRIKKYTFILT